MERTTQESFRVAMQLSEKRVKSTIDEYQAKIAEFEESEQEAFHALEKSDPRIQLRSAPLAKLSRFA